MHPSGGTSFWERQSCNFLKTYLLREKGAKEAQKWGKAEILVFQNIHIRNCGLERWMMGWSVQTKLFFIPPFSFNHDSRSPVCREQWLVFQAFLKVALLFRQNLGSVASWSERLLVGKIFRISQVLLQGESQVSLAVETHNFSANIEYIEVRLWEVHSAFLDIYSWPWLRNTSISQALLWQEESEVSLVETHNFCSEFSVRTSWGDVSGNWESNHTIV